MIGTIVTNGMPVSVNNHRQVELLKLEVLAVDGDESRVIALNSTFKGTRLTFKTSTLHTLPTSTGTK